MLTGTSMEGSTFSCVKMRDIVLTRNPQFVNVGTFLWPSNNCINFQITQIVCLTCYTAFLYIANKISFHLPTNSCLHTVIKGYDMQKDFTRHQLWEHF